MTAGVLLLAATLLLGAVGVFLIRSHKQNERDQWNFENMEEYLSQRQQLDTKRQQLEAEILQVERAVKGTVMLLFDQCAPNAYEIVYAQLSEFEMTGSLVFRNVLPGDEGVITLQQWQEMEQNGWSAVLATPTELMSDARGNAAYADMLKEYAERQRKAFADLGLDQPAAYAFAPGECTEHTLNALCEIGFTVFSAPDMPTKVINEECTVFQEAYLASGPEAPLIQADVERIKNKADALVIKTRYVHVTEDLSLDTDLTKFRMGMLNSLSGYRNGESILIDSLDRGRTSYLAQRAADEEADRQIGALQEQIQAIEAQLAALWAQYRS